MYYGTMTDKFMSCWGQARNKTNKMVICCDTYEQAETIERNALKRPEMKRVNICKSEPYYGTNVFISCKNYEDMGGSWLN